MNSTIRDLEMTGRNVTAQVLGWRIARLHEAGFERDDAAVVSLHIEVDLHQALDLVRRGCPPETALWILR